MKLKTLFVIDGVLAILVGAGFILTPVSTVAPFGVELTGAANLTLARLLGAAVLGYGILSWSVRNAEMSAALRAIMLTHVIADSINFVIALLAQLSGLFNGLFWVNVGLYAFLAIGFGYFYFQRQS